MEVVNATDTLASGSLLQNVLYGYRVLFYLVKPSETSHETLEEVPSYLLQVGRFLPMYLMTEVVLLLIQRKTLPRWNDALTSMCCIMLLLLPIAVIGNVELGLYSYVWDNYRLVTLPWDSTVTWLCGVLAADLGFYIWHRAAHEINLIWSFHQVHHTPEDFNIFTGAKLPSLNRQVAIFFYLPGAFFVPPSVFYTHYQLNYIYQFWIHTNAVPSLGFIEKIINTPSLHRVHHGRNRYCIDKNYGALFSVWDRLFGTFEEERLGVPISYGLVHPIRSWDCLYIQVHHLKYVFQKFQEYDNIGDKLSVFFKGPGWEPGKPRLGLEEDVPETPGDTDKYDKKLPLWANVYCAVQLVFFMIILQKIPVIKQVYTMEAWVAISIFLVWTVSNVGFLLEHKRWAPISEAIRCAAFFVVETMTSQAFVAMPTQLLVFRSAFALSLFFWYFNQDYFTSSKAREHAE